jgi:hypothetical protein
LEQHLVDVAKSYLDVKKKIRISPCLKWISLAEPMLSGRDTRGSGGFLVVMCFSFTSRD